MRLVETKRERGAADIAEWQARVDLAAAHRLAVTHGFSEGIFNHFTLAVPGRDDRYYQIPFGLHWSEVTASVLMEVGYDGAVLSGAGEVEASAFCIHAPIHRLIAKHACVLHTHMPFATALTLLDGGRLLMASQNALRFHNQVAYEDAYNGLVLDGAEAQRVAARLVDASVLFLAHHGVIVRGPSVAWAFDDLYYLERACMLQVLAQGTGRPLRTIPEHVVERTARQMAGERQQSDLFLKALRRMFP